MVAGARNQLDLLFDAPEILSPEKTKTRCSQPYFGDGLGEFEAI